MRLKKLRLFPVLILLCFMSILTIIGIFTFNNTGRQEIAAVPVSIIGSYCVDGQQTQKLTQKPVIDNNTVHTVKISGHFSSAIPKNEVLMLLLDNIRITFSINDREVYSSGLKGTLPAYSKTEGNGWYFFISPGISADDEIDITLQNVYAGTITNFFDEFLSNLSYGHGYELFHTLMKEKLPVIIFGFSVFVIGIIAFILCMAAGLQKAPGMDHGLALSAITMIGGCWIVINGGYPYISLMFDNAQLFNMIDVLQIYIISAAMAIFTYTCLKSNLTRKIAGVIAEVLLVLLTIAVFLQLGGWYDLYEIQNWATAIGLFTVLESILLLGYEALILKCRQTLFLLLSWLPLFLSGILEVLNFYFHFMTERGAVQYGFSMSILLQFIQLVHILRENLIRMQKASRLEYELLQNRMAIMLSQIQPHFIFNALNDIRFLYRESPEQAEKILISFTRYLRGNMDSLNQMEAVPFKQELDHLKNYIEIEKTRFGPRLNIVYEIDCMDFTLPVLTIQPLVENAIRHGIAPKREGGTVTIRTYKEPECYVIDVCDDGTGFDPSLKKADGQTHNGIENVRMRLQGICGGNLTIQSREGEGTLSRVCIPRKAELNRNAGNEYFMLS